MNKIILSGRLTKDVEVRYLQSQKAVATFGLAVSREYKNERGEYDADFFNVVIWGKPAELAGNTLKKGNKILIEDLKQKSIFGIRFSLINNDEYDVLTKSECKFIFIDYDLIGIMSKRSGFYNEYEEGSI